MARRVAKTIVAEEPSPEIKRKLKALKEVAGSLNDLSAEELQAFFAVAKRRPLFGNKR